MGDAAKPLFAKQNQEQEILHQQELKGSSLQKAYHDFMDECGNGHRKKTYTSLPKKKRAPGHYEGIPRRGPRSVFSSPSSIKNAIYSQKSKFNDTQRDQIKKWVSDDHHGTYDSWREYRSLARIPVYSRTRKDSLHEIEGARTRNGRQLQEDFMTEDVPDMQKGSSGNQCLVSGVFCATVR